MELHRIFSDDDYALNALRKGNAVKFPCTEDIGTYTLQQLFGDIPRPAAFAPAFFRATSPNDIASTFPSGTYKAPPAVPTFDFGREAGQVQRLVCKTAKGVTAKEGTDLTIIATGIAVQLSLEAARLLEAENIQARVIDMHTVKPLDEALVLQAARETGAILTVEEASTVGGLGGTVTEFLSGTCPVPVIRHGVPDEFGRSGTAAALLEYYGLTAGGIAEKAKEVLRLKANDKVTLR